MREWTTAAQEIALNDEDSVLIGYKPSSVIVGRHEMVKLPVSVIPGASGFTGVLYDSAGEPVASVVNGLIVNPLAYVIENLYSLYGAPLQAFSGELLQGRRVA